MNLKGKLGVTGHRPQKMYGFDEKDSRNIFVINSIKKFFDKYEPSHVYLGMALGSDIWSASWCNALGIPFTAVLPSNNQEKVWPEKSQKRYRKLLEKASEVIVVCQDEEIYKEKYAQILQDRNKVIVDKSDMMLGVFGGGPSGTRNCLDYAKEQGKDIFIINPGDYYSNITL